MIKPEICADKVNELTKLVESFTNENPMLGLIKLSSFINNLYEMGFNDCKKQYSNLEKQN